MNSHYPVDNNRDRNKAQGIFYFSDESKLVSCKPLLESGLYTHHIDTGQTAVSYSDPPVRETKQVQNCEPTPTDEVFSNSELMKIVEKAVIIRESPPPAASLPSFVSLHKVFLVAWLLCLFHAEGTCATISTKRFLEDGQLSLDDLKTATLCNDCLRRSRCCSFASLSIASFRLKNAARTHYCSKPFMSKQTRILAKDICLSTTH